MLPARHRLRDGRDFARAVRGRRAGSTLLVVHTRARPDAAGDARVGFVVSKAVGGAVVRNRTKRRLRAAMAPIVSHLPAGVDVVVRANPAAAAATYDDLERELGRLCQAATRPARAP